MVRITEEELLPFLSYSLWKSSSQIREEIEEKERIPTEKIYLSTIAIHLGLLHAEGYLERRENWDDDKRIRIRDGIPVYEYKMNEKGLKKRLYGDTKEDGLLSLLKPKLA